MLKFLERASICVGPRFGSAIGQNGSGGGGEHFELKDLETSTPLDVSVIQGMERR